MGKRTSLSKTLRFEVFKRDKFTCQYCGRMAPDVVLEVDHIKPVSKGGSSDFMNLITSCIDCNRGKGAKELSDDSTVVKQRKRIEELASKNEQLEMLLEWKEQLSKIHNSEVDGAIGIFICRTGNSLTDGGKQNLSRYIKKYGIKEVLESIEIAADKYFDGSEDGAERCFTMIPKICATRKKTRDNPKLYYFNYTKKIMQIRTGARYLSEDEAADIEYLIEGYINSDKDFEVLKRELKNVKDWDDFYKLVFDYDMGEINE